MDSPVIVALFVFVSIYLVFLLIRLFADFFLVAISLSSAVLAYHIEAYYSEFLIILQDSKILSLLHLTLPAQPEGWAIFVIAGFVIVAAVLLCIPILPFSATYRYMLGVENPAFARKEAKVRGWMIDEIERYHRQREVEALQMRDEERGSHDKYPIGNNQ